MLGATKTHTHIYIHTHTHIEPKYIHTYTHIHIHRTKIHTYIHTHMQHEWTGAWSDKDPRWTPALKKELNYETGGAYNTHLSKIFMCVCVCVCTPFFLKLEHIDFEKGT